MDLQTLLGHMRATYNCADRPIDLSPDHVLTIIEHIEFLESQLATAIAAKEEAEQKLALDSMSKIEWDMEDLHTRVKELESTPAGTALLAERTRMQKSLDWISQNANEIIVRREARFALTPHT